MKLIITEKRISIAVAVAVLAASVLVLRSFLSVATLAVSEPVWDCVLERDMWHCGIDFEIRNNTQEAYLVGYVIRSQRKLRRGVRTGSLMDIIDQHKYEREISADAVFRFSRTLRYEAEPDKITVTMVSKEPMDSLTTIYR